MLKHITWQEFLLAATLLTFLWYISVILLLFRKELKRLLTGKKHGAEKRPHSGTKENDLDTEQTESVDDDLMGKTKLPEGMSVMGMDEFSFRKRDEEHKEKMLGNIPDLLEEMKQLFQILKDEEGTKEDFLILMDGFKPRLKAIRTDSNQQSLNEFITRHAPFPLSERELENFWE
ncbi:MULTISPECIES: hypothetical protein [Olivibacter]|jgi:hypothetical protein|uniref:Uncharacterized protein n=2 Tax=Olivibacter TaxID=376469 RepID=A0ABV6HSS4_9SPHI|nr:MULTISPECIES: hypothetical protein [Olivibacter]QEL03914.1 hypothetical protein FKG96_24800 [Olivibacter sp. LS-1]